QPQLMRAMPDLIEPGGRVWVGATGQRNAIGDESSVLLGFDGKELVEAPVDVEGPGLTIDGIEFFPGRSEVNFFDGKSWGKQAFSGRCIPRLWTQADGKGVLAAGLAADDLWLWRSGAWKKLPSSIVNKAAADGYADASSSIQDVACVDKGAWILT